MATRIPPADPSSWRALPTAAAVERYLALARDLAAGSGPFLPLQRELGIRPPRLRVWVMAPLLICAFAGVCLLYARWAWVGALLLLAALGTGPLLALYAPPDVVLDDSWRTWRYARRSCRQLLLEIGAMAASILANAVIPASAIAAILRFYQEEYAAWAVATFVGLIGALIWLLLRRALFRSGRARIQDRLGDYLTSIETRYPGLLAVEQATIDLGSTGERRAAAQAALTTYLDVLSVQMGSARAAAERVARVGLETVLVSAPAVPTGSGTNDTLAEQETAV